MRKCANTKAIKICLSFCFAIIYCDFFCADSARKCESRRIGKHTDAALCQCMCVCNCVCLCVCVSVLWPAQFLWHQSLTLPLRQAMATNQRSQRHKLLLSFCCYALWIYCETNAKRKKKTNKSEKPLNGTPSILYTCIFLSPPIVLYSVLVLCIHITGRIEQ